MVLGEAVAFTPIDTLVASGFGWNHTNIAAIADAKQADGFRFVVLCYDLIPLLLPHYFEPRGHAQMQRYWDQALAIADVVVANAEAVGRDIAAYAKDVGVAVRAVHVAPLGADPPLADAPTRPLPAGLQAGRYALFVSTIEPRKGHELLYRVWRRLLAAGVPQGRGFQLVFVGRPGWMMETFDQTLAADAEVAGSLKRLERVDDAVLDQLYRQSAFCLYPSAYEGYGLPVIEAFARGKAVLASDGGALAEVAGPFSPVLGVGDEDAWFAAMKQWIEDPAVSAPYEQGIRERFQLITWAEAARRFFEAAGVSMV
jgi:glycosyltransferase involved in cell wall biosynthesis